MRAAYCMAGGTRLAAAQCSHRATLFVSVCMLHAEHTAWAWEQGRCLVGLLVPHLWASQQAEELWT